MQFIVRSVVGEDDEFGFSRPWRLFDLLSGFDAVHKIGDGRIHLGRCHGAVVHFTSSSRYRVPSFLAGPPRIFRSDLHPHEPLFVALGDDDFLPSPILVISMASGGSRCIRSPSSVMQWDERTQHQHEAKEGQDGTMERWCVGSQFSTSAAA